MLYRASENDFLASKFHEKCDNISDNLVIVETEYGKVIGGFTAFAWKSDGGSYLPATVNSLDHLAFLRKNF